MIDLTMTPTFLAGKTGHLCDVAGSPAIVEDVCQLGHLNENRKGCTMKMGETEVSRLWCTLDKAAPGVLSCV